MIGKMCKQKNNNNTVVLKEALDAQCSYIKTLFNKEKRDLHKKATI